MIVVNFLHLAVKIRNRHIWKGRNILISEGINSMATGYFNWNKY